MLSRRVFLGRAAACLALAGAPLPLAAQTKRLRRKDCYFGLHFDLHPNPGDPALGRDLTDEMVDRLLTRVKPDYVQYDCKGHVGYLGFPSKTGNSAPHIVKDSLEIWRRVTAQRGVALFIHFSGVWDSLAIQKHPEWASKHPDGTPDPNATSTFGPYVDDLMIPELKEAIEKYDLDGAWVDGECWAVRPDYSPAVEKLFTEATGIRQLPKGPGEAGWAEFLDMNRRQFRTYAKHYMDELHRFRPSFQIASNWMYTTLAPEKPELPVDYLSGDFLGSSSISTARLDARYLSSVGMPWDLMAWGFQSGSRGVGWSHKSAVQLEQEASVVLAQGGGFQIYYNPTRAGYIDDRNVGVMAKVGAFARERQPFCHKSEPVPQIGVVFSTNTLYTAGNKMFGGWGNLIDPARGMVDALVESGYPADVIPEWRLDELAARYPLIVLPDWAQVGLTVKKTLAAYVRAGGNLLLAGSENAALFSPELAVRMRGAAVQQTVFVPGGEVFANLSGVWQDAEPITAQAVEQRFPTYDSTRDGKCAASVNALGKGKIAAIYGPFGSVYAATHAPGARVFLRKVVGRLFRPQVEIAAPPGIEIALRRKDGKLGLHLLNATAMPVANDYGVPDFIPAIGPVEIRLHTPKAPAKVTLEPGGQPLTGRYANGVWKGSVGQLDIYRIAVFEGV
jgi:hypothetical protein